jgi:hypothetical protein
MQLADFQRMVSAMLGEIPAEYLEGIAGVEVSHRTVRDSQRQDVYTMGECIPLDVGGDPTPSRVVLYHGSFQALARERDDFDWRGEAWETLAHELRHHLEWRARAEDLEAYDWAAEQGYARSAEENFDPLFFLSGERIAQDAYQVDDDVFLDRVVREIPEVTDLEWEQRRYRIRVPPGRLPLYLLLRGIPGERTGDLILVLRRRGSVLDLFRTAQRPTERSVVVEPIEERR